MKDLITGIAIGALAGMAFGFSRHGQMMASEVKTKLSKVRKCAENEIENIKEYMTEGNKDSE